MRAIAAIVGGLFALVGVAVFFWVSTDLEESSMSDRGTSTSRNIWIDPFPHEERFVTVNGVRLHYLDWGGEGDLILIVHGLTGSPHRWDAVGSSLTDQYRVVGVTRRGHGLSEKLVEGMTIDTLVEDLAEFLDFLDAGSAILIGHSYAGVELPRLVGRYPDKAKALIFLDAVYDWRLLYEREAQFPFPQFGPPDSAHTSIESVENWWKETWPEMWTDSMRAHLRGATYVSAQGRVEFQFAPSSWALFVEVAKSWSPQEFSGIDIPVFVAWANEEEIWTELFERLNRSEEDIEAMRLWMEMVNMPGKRSGLAALAAAIPDAVVVELPKTFHWLQFQKPVEVVRLVRSFLDEHVDSQQ